MDIGSAALGVFCFGELECLPFPKGPCWTSCHPQQYLCILNDKFKVLESHFSIKILLLPPCPPCASTCCSATFALPTTPLCLCATPQLKCTLFLAFLPTAAFSHIPICPLPLAEQKPCWLTVRRGYERDSDLFGSILCKKQNAVEEEKGREAGQSRGKARRESIDETTFSNQTAFQGIKYEKVLLFRENKS